MFNSQELNLLSQSIPNRFYVQQRQIAERKTLPSFINENPEKDKKELNLNMTFTFVPTAKHYEEENCNPLPPNAQRTKKVHLYQKQIKSYIIKPKLHKKLKQRHKSNNQINDQSKESSDSSKEDSSQTSVDDSDEDKTNSSQILDELKKEDTIDLGNSKQLEKRETLNVVLFDIKIIKLLNTETNSPYALFTIKGDNDTTHVLYYDNRELYKELITILTSGKYIQCKMLQKTIEEKGNSLFRKKLVSYSLIEIIKK